MTLTQIEEVVLLDADDRPIGRAPKSSVHGAETALPSGVLVPRAQRAASCS